MSYRRYARELKDQACALVTEEKYDPANAGRQLGIPEMTLRGWLASQEELEGKPAHVRRTLDARKRRPQGPQRPHPRVGGQASAC